VIDVTPRAVGDIFGVAQDSSAKQLDVLQNDYDPNDDPLLIRAVSPSANAAIAYAPDGSIFQYTPNPGFWGIDSFTYTITNFHGGSATGTVILFVNETGNQSPLSSDVAITLSTYNYVGVFNALSNSLDADNDALSLFAVSTPRLGTISTNAGGDVTYTRNPDFFGADKFRYVVTDGFGGYSTAEVTISQADTLGDGIPDEWKLKYGLDPSIDQSTLDPDADGVPNLGEFQLHTNPKVSDNPLNLALTNEAELSGYVQVGIPALDPVLSSLPISLYVNGSPAANSSLWHGPDGEWFLNWDTVFLTNGTYTVQAGFQYDPDASFGVTSIAFGLPATVQVTNLIQFDQLTRQFSSFLIINAALAVPRANYLVQLYDTNGSPLVYTTGSTTNGMIQLYWDLTDGQGNQISFGDIQAEFEIEPAGSTNTTTVLQWFLKEPDTGPGNTFAIAWGFDSYTTSFNNYSQQMMLDGVINILGDPSNPNAYFLAPSANFPLTTAFRFDNSSDKQVLLSALPLSDYFFWFGHGSYNGLYGNRNRANIGPTDIQGVLHNAAFQSRPNHPKDDNHPYRLVILNGCETYASWWAGVFGIPFSASGSTNVVLDYQYTGRMPRAFVGWTNNVDVPTALDFGGSAHALYGQALAELFSKWMAEYPLEYCLDFYQAQMDSYSFPNNFQGQDSWLISGCVDLTR